jgi:hypothetical protein
MTAAVYLNGELSWVHHHIRFRTLTRIHDHRVSRAQKTTAGGDDMPCGAERAEIGVPIRAETSGGKSACAVAIAPRMAKSQN